MLFDKNDSSRLIDFISTFTLNMHFSYFIDLFRSIRNKLRNIIPNQITQNDVHLECVRVCVCVSALEAQIEIGWPNTNRL